MDNNSEQEIENIIDDLEEILDNENETEIEAIETISDSAVQIAEIEADKEIAITEINAAVAIAQIEQNNEQENESDITWLKNQLPELVSAIQKQTQTLTLLLDNLLIQQLPQVETIMETVEVTNPSSESADAPLEPQPEPKRTQKRII